MEKPAAKKTFARKLVHKYRLIVRDDAVRKNKFSLKLNLLNLLLFFAAFSILVIGLTLLMLRYSPLKSYFVEPATFDEAKSKKELLQLTEKMMKIEDSLQTNQFYIENLRRVISGELTAAQLDTAMMSQQYKLSFNDKKLAASEEDSIFRSQIAKEELQAAGKSSSASAGLLFVPLKGVVTDGYDIKTNHLAIDIAAKMGEGIKAMADGMIIFSDWTPDAGYVVVLRHPNDMISVYKHCSQTYKKMGETVERGEVIAAVGDSGELTTGPHLHFELWVQGIAVDPQQYIDF